MLLYRIAADVMVVIHAAYVATVVGGLVLVLVGRVRGWRWIRNFWFRIVHFLMIAVVAGEALGAVVCPLTRWENQLRVLGGEDAGGGSFIGRMVHGILFYDLPEGVFTVAYILFALAVLAALFWAPPERPPWLRKRRSAGPLAPAGDR
ncbi:MAG: DUF2784 domain-containing protein [Thermoguttaceae bacterium]|jgi:hypothetical protein